MFGGLGIRDCVCYSSRIEMYTLEFFCNTGWSRMLEYMAKGVNLTSAEMVFLQFELYLFFPSLV